MKVIGLTGGVGMGKSACAQLLRAKGLPLVDTDELARAVVEPGQPALAEVQSLFGPDIVGPDGRLRRDELARRVFSDSLARQKLEQILHPRIRRLWQAQVETWRSETHPLAIVVIPLLFETGADRELDATVCIACSKATQQQRLQLRGWSLLQIEQRNSAQWPADKKLAASTFVIWTEGGMDVHAAQLDRILQRLRDSA